MSTIRKTGSKFVISIRLLSSLPMDAARQISSAFDVSPQRSFQRQMEGMERMMADAYTAGKNAVILLDDAQLMNSEALEVVHRLYNFDYDAKVGRRSLPSGKGK